MDLSYFLSLLLFTFTATITPGPNNLMVTASGATFGFRRTIPHILGIACGFMILLILTACGLGVIFERWPAIHNVLRIVGAAYLLFLAWKIYRAGRVRLDTSSSRHTARPLSFWQAAAFQWINPKAWTMAITALAAFTLPPPLHIWSAGAVVLAYFLMAFPCCSLWTLLGQELVRRLHSERARLRFNGSLAGLTVASVVLLFY